MLAREQVSSRDSPKSEASAIDNVWGLMGSFVASFSPAVSPLQAGASPDLDHIPDFPCVCVSCGHACWRLNCPLLAAGWCSSTCGCGLTIRMRWCCMLGCHKSASGEVTCCVHEDCMSGVQGLGSTGTRHLALMRFKWAGGSVRPCRQPRRSREGPTSAATNQASPLGARRRGPMPVRRATAAQPLADSLPSPCGDMTREKCYRRIARPARESARRRPPPPQARRRLPADGAS